jgi:hypothetical protein
VSADAVLSGQPPPAEGACFDFYLEGPIRGPELQGTFRGMDYIYFRADGGAELLDSTGQLPRVPV